jgi:hypothetical protein
MSPDRIAWRITTVAMVGCTDIKHVLRTGWRTTPVTLRDGRSKPLHARSAA